MNHDFCPIYESINLLQEKWTLHIVRSLLEGAKGFNELGRDIGGCNPTTLTQRLERLEAAGIVEKSVQSTMPPRTRYTLTEAGVGARGCDPRRRRVGQAIFNANGKLAKV